MSEDFGIVAMDTVNNPYLAGDTSLSCSSETQAEIDRLVVKLVENQYQKAKKIIEDSREKLDELTEYLYEKETISGTQFMEILEG